MMIGIFWALLAGLMLGLYALPGKFTKKFEFENTWGLFFLLTMFVVPIIATFTMMSGVGEIYSQLPNSKLAVMIVASFLWGTGVMMWGKAINHIGMSLGFSLFIGTVILVGSILPFFIDGLPSLAALVTILLGIAVVLLGVIANAKAGLTREKDEAKEKTEEEAAKEKRGSMGMGIFIAVFGGLLATGFSVANTVSKPELPEAVAALGNPEWVTALAIMFPVFLSGGVVMTIYFIWQLTQKKAWAKFKTPHFPLNFVLIFIMAFFHYAASAMFAYAAYKLGGLGNTVGYAIFNTSCVVVAIISGIITKEWVEASAKAKRFLYIGLTCMVLGVVIIALGNKLNKPEPKDETVVMVEQKEAGL